MPGEARNGPEPRTSEEFLEVIESGYPTFHPPFTAGSWGESAMFQNPRELAGFCEYLRDKPVKKYLEVGVGRGMLMRFMREVMGYEVLGVESTAWEPLALEAGCIILGNSRAPETLARVEAGAPYDLVFIDADHSYDSARLDYRAYRGFSRMFIALHDIAYGPEPGVGRLWAELPENKMAFIDPDPVMRLAIGLLPVKSTSL